MLTSIAYCPLGRVITSEKLHYLLSLQLFDSMYRSGNNLESLITSGRIQTCLIFFRKVIDFTSKIPKSESVRGYVLMVVK